jgi:hypothetical protein
MTIIVSLTVLFKNPLYGKLADKCLSPDQIQYHKYKDKKN